jgi:hypothetical protein
MIRSRRWANLEVGSVVDVRAKRTPRERRTVIVRELLDRDLADGLGFADEGGEIFRAYFYDIEIHDPHE